MNKKLEDSLKVKKTERIEENMAQDVIEPHSSVRPFDE